ncbi:hypothetical protein NPIL_198701 [Nephila pilipes]|uniref:Uncharacterized protein n=1 Tax=Nephila pilipes TaxID=299642 RepID=A0A8X6U0Y1_NEPPI|nr:hypothetical protein NPIL_198701 [Nephila pilipes]
MARTKQTAQKEKAESIANTDRHDLENDTDNDEMETMDMENENSTDQDRNMEACFLRTNSLTLHYPEYMEPILPTRDNDMEFNVQKS